MEKPIFYLTGSNLTIENLMELGAGKYRIELSPDAWKRVRESRDVIENILKEDRKVYGVNTGFGNFADVKISPMNVAELQENLIRSHSAGVGNPLTLEQTRRLLALRINVLAKGYSGVSESTLKAYIDAFNNDCLSWVPELGTLGASGDLAPLAHLALGLMGEGKMWNPTTRQWDEAAAVLKQHHLSPLKLKAKDGLALINGTQMICAIGAEAIWRAQNAIKTADIIAALTLEALRGSCRAFREEIHLARPHAGQLISSRHMRQYLHSERYPSEINESHKNCGKVQDAYSLRCTPQVHGIVYDTIAFAKHVLETEINSATDNPMVITSTGELLSGGNFHGEYPAKVLDYLTIAIHEAGNISERRIERLMNPAVSGLPAFLIKSELGGLHSGTFLTMSI
jgi:histidine ammonia-lyase